MKLKTYHGSTLAEALAQVKRDLGSDAVILHTRSYRRGGVLGFGTKPRVEITASSEVNVAPKLKPRRAAPPANHALQRAYGSPSARTAAATPTATLTPPRQPGPVTVATASPAVDDTQLADEIAALKKMVQRVVRSSDRDRADLPQPLFELYLSLLDNEVSEELAEDVIAQVRRAADGSCDAKQLKKLAADSIAKMIPTGGVEAIKPRADGRPHKLALIGPTGVGKTTTLAKLAADCKLRHKLNVALVTIDTYRIAAVEQLRTYAQIIGVPLHVANSPMDMRTIVEKCAGYDVLLIDTAGRSQRDGEKLGELRAYLDAADPDEVHLVLASNARHDVMLEAAERFAAIGTDRIIFTKLDEAVSFGVLLNVARKVNKRLSFVTTGQEVPRDIEPGCSKRLARLIMGESLK